MRNSLSLAKRILQQLSHDPRTIVLFIVAPVLILWLFSMILGSPEYNPKIAAVDLPEQVVAALKDENAKVEIHSQTDAQKALIAGEVDAKLTFENRKFNVMVEGTNSSKTQATIKTLQGALGKLTNTEMFAVNYLYGSSEWSLFDFVGPMFIGIFIFIFVFLTSGMSLVTERTGGTMERLLVTPIKSWQLALGYALGFGSVALVQSVIVLLCCTNLLGFPNKGSLVLVTLFTLTMALVSLTLGLLISALAKTAFQVVQFMIIFVMPQVFFSGIFDLSQSPEWMRVLSKCFPITYGADALRGIMLRGSAITEVWKNLMVLWSFIAVFFTLSSLSLNKRRVG